MARPSLKTDPLTNTLIILWTIAVVLGIIALIVVFYPSGSYTPVVSNTASGTISFENFPTSTPSSSLTISTSTGSLTNNSSSASSTTTVEPPGTFASTYTSPYPISWTEGKESFAVTGATWNGEQLTLSLSIQMGSISECVPLNVRLVADESGTLQTPSSPAGPNFIFPDTQTCDGIPQSTYSEPVTFTIDPTLPAPFILTTGGSSNVFFEVTTSTTGGVNIALPSDAG